MRNLFKELKNEEILEVNGGLGVVAGVAIGIGAGWVVDGVLGSTTGKSGGDWVATGIETYTAWRNSPEAKAKREFIKANTGNVHIGILQ